MSREHQHAEGSAVLVQWESQTHVYTFYFVTYEQNDSRSAATCLDRQRGAMCLFGKWKISVKSEKQMWSLQFCLVKQYLQ